MSSALDWPVGDVAGLVSVDVGDDLIAAGLSPGIEGAFGEVLFSCATVTVAINATERSRVSDGNVFRMFMLRLCSRQGSQVKSNYFARDAKKRDRRTAARGYQPRTLANTNGATIVASDSIMNFGVSTLSLPHVIFSLGTAPEYDPKLVVESLIWQK